MRLQAIFRGRQVRKQAAITLRCMQALVRVQARFRTQSIESSLDGDSKKKSVSDDPIKQAEVTNQPYMYVWEEYFFIITLLI